MTKSKRRISGGTILIILIALAILIGLGIGWAQCGLGRGDGDSEGTAQTAAELPDEAPPAADARPPLCRLTVASDGAIFDEARKKLTVQAAVARCREGTAAILEVAGNAPYGAVDDLRKALEEAGLEVREP